MAKFNLHWKNGKVETIEGDDIATAFTAAGYNEGAIEDLERYNPVVPSVPAGMVRCHNYSMKRRRLGQPVITYVPIG